MSPVTSSTQHPEQREYEESRKSRERCLASDNPFVPSMELHGQLSISTTPGINISRDVAKNFSRGGVPMVENFGVPSFPDVPEDENHNIILDSTRQQRWEGDIQGVPRWTHAPRSEAETRLLGPEVMQ